MAQFLAGMVVGSIVGILTMCLFQINNEEKEIVQ